MAFRFFIDGRYFAKKLARGVGIVGEILEIWLLLVCNDFEVWSYLNHLRLMEVYFSGISEKIEECLLQAKSSIVIALAWFTDRDLVNTLHQCKKGNKNLEIKIVLSNDRLNPLSIFKKLGSTSVRVCYDKKFMHNKICVIDRQVAITGSYNWTYNARKSFENILVIDNKKVAEEYHTEVSRLFESSLSIDAVLKDSNVTIDILEEETRLVDLHRKLHDEILDNWEESFKNNKSALTDRLERFYNRKARLTKYVEYLVLSGDTQDGLVRLYNTGRLDKSFEALVNKPEYSELFSDQIKESGRQKLVTLNYEI